MALPCPRLGHVLHRARRGQQDAHRARQHHHLGRARHTRRHARPRVAPSHSQPRALRPRPPARSPAPWQPPARPWCAPERPWCAPQGWPRPRHCWPRALATLTPSRSASQAGLACLVGCLCCATAYRPAPLRRPEHEHDQVRVRVRLGIGLGLAAPLRRADCAALHPSPQGTALLAAAVRALPSAPSRTVHNRAPHPNPVPGARQSRKKEQGGR